MSNTVSTELADFNDSQLSTIGSFADVERLMADAGVVLSEFGTGFRFLEDKDKARLVKVPFVIIQWQFRSTDDGDFVTVTGITQDNRKFIFNDGSWGIYQQLLAETENRQSRGEKATRMGLVVPGGLREYSDFAKDQETGEYRMDDKGKKIPFTRYYLS